MNAPGHSIALAVILAILVTIAPHKASAHGGTIHLWTAWSHLTTSRAVAGTGAHTGVLGRIRNERSRP
jgi:hypothetical protein